MAKDAQACFSSQFGPRCPSAMLIKISLRDPRVLQTIFSTFSYPIVLAWHLFNVYIRRCVSIRFPKCSYSTKQNYSEKNLFLAK